MKRNTFLIALLSSVLALIAVSCSPASAPTAAPTLENKTAGAPATVAPTQKPLTQIKFATGGGGLAVTYTWIVAGAKGFFKEQGLQVEGIVSGNNNQTIAGLYSGDVNLASVATESVAAANLKGTVIPIVGGDESGVLYPFIVTDKIQKWEDLKGKTLATGLASSKYDKWLRELLNAHGIKPGVDVEMAGIGNNPEREAAVLSGRAVGSLFSSDRRALFESKGGFHVLAEFSNQGEWAQVIAVSPKFLKDNPDAIVAFLKGYIKGRQWAHDPKNLAELGKIVENSRAKDYNSETFPGFIADNVARRPADLSINLTAVDAVITGVTKDLTTAGEKDLKAVKAADLVKMDILKQVWADLGITPSIKTP